MSSASAASLVSRMCVLFWSTKNRAVAPHSGACRHVSFFCSWMLVPWMKERNKAIPCWSIEVSRGRIPMDRLLSLSLSNRLSIPILVVNSRRSRLAETNFVNFLINIYAPIAVHTYVRTLRAYLLLPFQHNFSIIMSSRNDIANFALASRVGIRHPRRCIARIEFLRRWSLTGWSTVHIRWYSRDWYRDSSSRASRRESERESFSLCQHRAAVRSSCSDRVSSEGREARESQTTRFGRRSASLNLPLCRYLSISP